MKRHAAAAPANEGIPAQAGEPAVEVDPDFETDADLEVDADLDSDFAPAVGRSAVDKPVDKSVDEAVPGLSERERAILAFEGQWWKHAGAKEQAIRDQFELSATRYYQVLNALLDNPAAVAAEPLVVGRLRRLRATRSRARRR
jgi:hypothetical protein